MCKQVTERQFEQSSFQGPAPSQGVWRQAEKRRADATKKKNPSSSFLEKACQSPPEANPEVSASARDCLDDPRKLQQKMGE